MFTWIAAQLTNLQLRLQLAWTRVPQIWGWFLAQVRAVQIAVIADLLIMFGAILLTVVVEDNWPARYAFIPVLFLWIYITRKMVLPVWFGELGATLADRGVGLIDSWIHAFSSRLPRWVTWTFGGSTPTPGPHPIATVSGASHGQLPVPIWHDTSVGGHMFHVLSTVWMWMHVLLLTCGVFPVWEQDWLSAVVMLTVFILFFVATEEFVDIKKWRFRLAMAVTVIAVCYLVPMTFRVLAPGTYQNVRAKLEYHETIQETEAENTRVLAVDDQLELRELLAKDRRFKSQYRAWQKNTSGVIWNADKARNWKTTLVRIEELRSQDQSGEDYASHAEGWAMDHFMLLLIAIGAMAILWPSRWPWQKPAPAAHGGGH